MNIEIAPIEFQKELNWYDARLYCFSLTIDGKTGWRLPTNKEQEFLKSLTIESADEWYWTSDDYAENLVVCYNWHSEMCASAHKEKNACYARPVRDLKDN